MSNEYGLILETKQGPVLIVGCSHPRVDKLAHRVGEAIGEKPLLVIGGFHSSSRRTIDRLAEITKYIAPAHCTGDHAKKYIAEKYAEKYIPVRTGSIIEITETIKTKY